MAYQKLNWKNGADPTLSAENLNHMDDGIASASEVADRALEAAGNVKGTWVQVPLAEDSPATMKDSTVYFNEKLGLAMFIFAGYTSLSASDVLVKLASNPFTITTGSFYVVGTNKANTVIGTRSIKVTKFENIVSGEVVNHNLNGAATNTWIYQTVIVGATKK